VTQQKKLRGLLVMSLLIITAAVSTSCWDKQEVEELGYVAVIGIDSRKDGMLDITFQTSNPQVGTSTQMDVDEPASEIITFPASGTFTARELASISATRRLTFAHVRAVIVGEQFAKSEHFFRQLEVILRDRDFRSEINLIVSREKASDFIRNNDPQMETNIMKYYTFMSKRWRETGISPISTLFRFVQRTQDNAGAFLAIYATTKELSPKEMAENDADYTAGQLDKRGGNPTQMIGSAVFKKGRMIGTLTGDETRMAYILRIGQGLERSSFDFPDPLHPEYRISGRASSKKPRVSMDLKSTAPKIDVIVPFKIEAIAMPSFINYVTDLEKQKLLKQSIEEYMETKAKTLIKKTQEEFGAEPFQWGTYARRHFSLTEEYWQYDWMKKYPSAEVYVKFDVEIENFGRELNPPNPLND
jgi:spore germination protein KC